MKVIDILKISEAFNFLSEKELDLNTAYVIANNLAKLNIGQNIIIDKKKQLVNKYGAKNSKGDLILEKNGEVQFTSQNKTAFFMEIEKLNESEIDMEKIAPVSKKALYESGIKIPPKYIMFLSDYIHDEEK